MSLERFIASLEIEGKLASRSIEAYKNDLEQYARWLKSDGSSLTKASAIHLQSYLEWMEAQGRRPSSVKRSASAASRYYRFTGRPLRRGEVARPIVEAETHTFGRALTEHKLTLIRSAVRGDRFADTRNAAAVELIYGSGLRVSELVGLDIGDVSLTKGVVRPMGKHGVHRVVPIGGIALDLLAQWVRSDRKNYAAQWGADHTFSRAVFINREGIRITRQAITRMITSCAAGAGIRGTVAPHMIRDSCARDLLRGGANRSDVDLLLGHIASGTKQAPTWEEVERLRSVLQRAHPAWGL